MAADLVAGGEVADWEAADEVEVDLEEEVVD